MSELTPDDDMFVGVEAGAVETWLEHDPIEDDRADHIQEGRRLGNFLAPGCEAADRQECFSCGFPSFSGAVLEQVSIGDIWSGFHRLILKPRISNTPLFSLPF